MHLRSTIWISLCSLACCAGCAREPAADGRPAAQEANPERAYLLEPADAKQRVPAPLPEGTETDPQVESR